MGWYAGRAATVTDFASWLSTGASKACGHPRGGKQENAGDTLHRALPPF